MTLIIDSSMALSWCFEDERDADAVASLQRVAEAGARAPALWPIEIANGLLMAQRRGRVAADKRRQLLVFLQQLPVTVDAETAARAWDSGSQLAEQHQLTVYDALYLELALRSGLPLATRDRALQSAAVAAGAQVFSAGA